MAKEIFINSSKLTYYAFPLFLPFYIRLMLNRIQKSLASPRPLPEHTS